MTYRFQLLAEYNQFYLQDEFADEEVDWDESEGRNQLALKPATIAVGTLCERVVPVVIHVRELEIEQRLEDWDQIIDCNIDVPSGRLVVVGCCEGFKKAARIELNPGKYRARICYGNQYSCGGVRGGCCDHYKIILWPSSDESVRILKRRIDVDYELIA